MKRCQHVRVTAGLTSLVVVVTMLAPMVPVFAQAREPVNLFDAVHDGSVVAEFRGTGFSSGPSILVTARRGPNAPAGRFRVAILTGAGLGNFNRADQNMVIAGVLGPFLGTDGDMFRFGRSPVPPDTLPIGSAPVTYLLSAFCAQFDRNNPGINDTFSLDPPDPVLTAILRRGMTLSVAATQAAVWMHTDRLTFSQMNQKFPVSAADWTAAERAYSESSAR